MLKRVLSQLQSSLKYKLIIYFLFISIIPFLILSCMSYVNIKEILISKEKSYSNALVKNNMSNIDYALSSIENNLLTLKTNLLVYNYLKYVSQSNFQTSYSEKLIDEIGSKLDSVIELNGDAIDSVYILPKTEGVPIYRGDYNLGLYRDYKNSDIFRRTINNKYKILWQPATKNSQSKRKLMISTTIEDPFNGKVIGIVLLYVNLDELIGGITSLQLRKNEEILIFDKNQNIIFTSNNYTNSNILKNKVKDLIFAHKSNTYFINGNYNNSIVTFTTSKVNQWKLVSVLPSTEILGYIKVIIKQMSYVLLFMILIAVTAATLLFTTIYRPISVLINRMKAVRKGDFNVLIEKKGNDEFRQLSDAFNFLITYIKDLIYNIEKEQKKKKELEIKALQSQITPHFLYNTLNSIKSLARLKRNQDIIEMVTALIDLLRVSANYSNDTIRVQEELEYAKSYLKIMKYRYQMPIEFQVNIEEGLSECKILRFTFQPIIENAIIHGFQNNQSKCLLQISAFRMDFTTYIEIIDNGKGISNDDLKKILNYSDKESPLNQKFNSIGLKNVHERIQLYFGKEYGLSIISKENQGTKITIKIPYK